MICLCPQKGWASWWVSSLLSTLAPISVACVACGFRLHPGRSPEGGAQEGVPRERQPRGSEGPVAGDRVGGRQGGQIPGTWATTQN